jgi:long-chain acyl-CoA synthetase
VTNPNSVTNLAELVRRHRNSDRPALVFRETTLTWAELDRKVDQAAAALRGLGLAEGDRVALQLPNVPEFPVAFFGALRAGLVAVPVNVAYTGRELAHVLTDSGARAIVTSPAGAEAAGPAVEHVLTAGAAWDALLDGAAGAEVPETARGGEDLGVLLYTSGTSGRPRGAMLSHRALLANLEQCSAIQPPLLGSGDTVLLVLPLFHIYGLNPGLGMVAWHGATGVLAERFDPHGTVELIARHRVTVVVGAPPMYVAWSLLPDLGEPFSHVRLALSGAAPLPGDTLRRLLDTTGHHVFEGYGLTESGPVLTSTLRSEVAKPDSIGRPIPGVELKLLEDDGDETEEDDPGQIWVRGKNLFSGYWPDGSGGPGEDGWWPTGDVAYADEDGDLHLVDRLKELVLVSGFNVYPREVEDVLAAHADIEEAAVIGVPHPYTGETVKAFVVPRNGAGLSAEDVIAWCEGQLARFKCPTSVEFVTKLPHSATGKVRKAELRGD